MSTQGNYQIHATRKSDGKDCGFWKTSGGWKRSGTSTTSREQFGQGRVQHGGPAIYEDVTAKRTNYAGDDIPGVMLADVNKEKYILNRQKLDNAGFATGKPDIRTGMLVAFEFSDVDVETDTPGVDEYTATWAIEG